MCCKFGAHLVSECAHSFKSIVVWVNCIASAPVIVVEPVTGPEDDCTELGSFVDVSVEDPTEIVSVYISLPWGFDLEPAQRSKLTMVSAEDAAGARRRRRTTATSFNVWDMVASASATSYGHSALQSPMALSGRNPRSPPFDPALNCTMETCVQEWLIAGNNTGLLILRSPDNWNGQLSTTLFAYSVDNNALYPELIGRSEAPLTITIEPRNDEPAVIGLATQLTVLEDTEASLGNFTVFDVDFVVAADRFNDSIEYEVNITTAAGTLLFDSTELSDVIAVKWPSRANAYDPVPSGATTIVLRASADRLAALVPMVLVVPPRNVPVNVCPTTDPACKTYTVIVQLSDLGNSGVWNCSAVCDKTGVMLSNGTDAALLPTGCVSTPRSVTHNICIRLVSVNDPPVFKQMYIPSETGNGLPCPDFTEVCFCCGAFTSL